MEKFKINDTVFVKKDISIMRSEYGVDGMDKIVSMCGRPAKVVGMDSRTVRLAFCDKGGREDLYFSIKDITKIPPEIILPKPIKFDIKNLF